MDEDELLEMLEGLATGLGVAVRYEPTGGRSGSGVLRGQTLAIIDSELGVRGRAEALAAVLADEDYEEQYLPPAVRELLERRRG